MKKNIILDGDSYKYSQFNQYPEGTEYVYSYIESRGGAWDATVFFGLQMFIREYLVDPITMDDINEAEDYILEHGEPFYREGWEYILREHGGKLPVRIMAAQEGLVIPLKNVLLTIVNTDPKCWWLTSFLETVLLRAVWYPTTVATNSFETKKLIAKGFKDTSDEDVDTAIQFKLNDFGSRGVSSRESSGIGGLAHLVNFMGTDNVTALRYGREYYHIRMAGFSIPAMEHSTVTSWGRDHEVDSYRNMIKKNAKPGGMVACVSDSYDIYNACKLWGTELKQDIIDSGAIVVVRPDSGDPATVVVECLRILDEYFGHVVNKKGYKVINNVRVIQGDGINHQSIRSIIFCMKMAGYSIDNLALGQGGALLQIVDRDTMQFAMKCCAIRVNGIWRDVYKDPITDKGKASKTGQVTLYYTSEGYHSTVRADNALQEALELVYEDGELKRDMTFDEIRANTKKGL